MSPSGEQFDELGQLTAALCDGEITPEQAARLERLASRSDQTRRYFLDYVQLGGELYWESAASAGRSQAAELEPSASGAPAAARPSPLALLSRVRPGSRWIAATVAAALLLIVAWWGIPRWNGSRPASPVPVARLTRTLEAKWSGGPPVQSEHERLLSGQTLDLREGLAEITFDSGARVILDAPAHFEVSTAQRGFLNAGKLTANVTGPPAGFTIQTPSSTVVDFGTQFGVAVEQNGTSEVHVFVGTVEVRSGTEPSAAGPRREVCADQAVRVPLSSTGAEAPFEEITVDSGSFVRTFRAPGPVARLRALVARHPSLIHHYTFDGATREEKRRDKRGDLNLVEVVMQGGRGEGSLEYSAAGFDGRSDAVHPYRSAREGNNNGVSLQSEATFDPPKTLTVELLLNFAGLDGNRDGEIRAAVATRGDQRDCGFFVVAAEGGRLVHLMDGDAAWIESDVEFAAGDWYYVASTFRTRAGKTTVNAYVANLSQGDRRLRCCLKDHLAAGVPAASRLGVGKGFDSNIAHAYPWSGMIDEVAIYDTVLDPRTLGEHLEALVGEK